MAEPPRDERTKVEDGYRASMFVAHNAFARLSRGLDADAPLHHDPSYDRKVASEPVQVNPVSAEDMDRAEGDVLVLLASAVEDHCTSILVDLVEDIETIDAYALNDWLRSSAEAIRMDTRTNCAMDVVMDVELDVFVPTDSAGDYDLGRGMRSPLNGMARHQPVSDGFYAIIAAQHIVGLAGHIAMYLTAHNMGEGMDFIASEAVFPYAPRVAFHPGAIKIARIEFENEAAWRAAAHLSNVAEAVQAETPVAATPADASVSQAPHTIQA